MEASGGILWIQDAHLRPRMWLGDGKVLGDAYDAMSQLRDLAIARRVEAVLFGGDLFHRSEIDGWSLAVVREFADSLRTALPGIRLAGIEGNHDRDQHVSFLTALGMDDLGKAFPHPATLAGMTVVGMPQLPRTRLHEELARVPACDILAMHVAFRHMLGFDDAWQLEADDVPEHVRLVLVGDVHVHAEAMNRSGTVRIVSSGSTYPQRLNEIGIEHGAFLVRSPDDVEFVRLDCRAFLPLEWDGKDVSGLLGRLRHEAEAHVRDRLAPVALVRSVARMPEGLAEEAGISVIHQVPDVISVSGELPVLVDGDDGPTLRSCLPAVVDASACPEEFGLLADMLEDPAGGRGRVKEFVRSRIDARTEA